MIVTKNDSSIDIGSTARSAAACIIQNAIEDPGHGIHAYGLGDTFQEQLIAALWAIVRELDADPEVSLFPGARQRKRKVGDAA